MPLGCLNRELLEQAYRHPERATDYDLTAPLNPASYATPFIFQSILPQITAARSAQQHPPLPGVPRLRRQPAQQWHAATGDRCARKRCDQPADHRAHPRVRLPDLVVTPWGGGASCITVSPSR
jgi:hypothetical protein